MDEHIISEHLVHYLIRNKVFNEDEFEVYVYAYEILFSTVIGTVWMISISAIMGNLWYVPAFLAGFIPLRVYIGGYHATSHLKCHLVFTIVFLLSIIYVQHFPVIYFYRCCIVMLNFLISSFFAPIESHNKKLSREQKAHGKSVCVFLCHIDIIILMFDLIPYGVLGNLFYISKAVIIVFSGVSLVQRLLKK